MSTHGERRDRERILLCWKWTYKGTTSNMNAIKYNVVLVQKT